MYRQNTSISRGFHWCRRACTGAPTQAGARACVVDEQRAVEVEHRAVVALESEGVGRGGVAGDADVACGGQGACCSSFDAQAHECRRRVKHRRGTKICDESAHAASSNFAPQPALSTLSATPSQRRTRMQQRKPLHEQAQR